MDEIETITLGDDEETPHQSYRPRKRRIPLRNAVDSDEEIILESDWQRMIEGGPRDSEVVGPHHAEDEVVVLESETASPPSRRRRRSPSPPPPPSDWVMRQARLMCDLSDTARQRRRASTPVNFEDQDVILLDHSPLPPSPPSPDRRMRRSQFRSELRSRMLSKLSTEREDRDYKSEGKARRERSFGPTVARGTTIMVLRHIEGFLARIYTHVEGGEKGSLRPIVIDGCNVAMAYGGEKFSVWGITIVVDFFLKRGHTKVVAFLPQKKCRDQRRCEREELERLKKEKHLVYTPSRLFNNEVISSYDDTFILDYAAKYGAIVVTRDNYRDLANQKTEWDQVIKERILMPTFVGKDCLIWPHNPLGNIQISLDDFLKF